MAENVLKALDVSIKDPILLYCDNLINIHFARNSIFHAWDKAHRGALSHYPRPCPGWRCQPATYRYELSNDQHLHEDPGSQQVVVVDDEPVNKLDLPTNSIHCIKLQPHVPQLDTLYRVGSLSLLTRYNVLSLNTKKPKNKTLEATK